MLFSIRKYTESFQKGNSLIIYFLLKKRVFDSFNKLYADNTLYFGAYFVTSHIESGA